jgi:hypothetical protein
MLAIVHIKPDSMKISKKWKLQWILLLLFEGMIIGVYAQKTQKYILDTTSSRLFWKCDIHNGFIKMKSGQLTLSGEEIMSGKIVADMNTIQDIDIDYDLMRQTLENILKSPEFFDVQNFPESYFVLDKSEKITDNTYHVDGDLTILGGDICVSFDVELSFPEKNKLLIKSSVFKVDRTKYGIRLYSSKYPNNKDNPQEFVVPDEMLLHVELSFFFVEE